MQKRCSKGKSCGATCIDPRERCVLELGPLVGDSTTKVVSILQKSSSGGAGGGSPSAPTINSHDSSDQMKSSKFEEVLKRAYG